jgi:hypothetical protein
MAIKDNKDILRYRGVATPGQTRIDARNAAIARAVLNINAIGTNINAEYTTTDAVKQVNTNPFMRLLPNAATDTIYDFYFPFAPQGISYNDMSDEISEIPRAGTTPLVAFTSHKLLKVSFEFLVAVPYDGMELDVEDSISLLRIFSTSSDRSVIFFNFDTMLTSAWQYRRGPDTRALYFNITDMSITARQRNSFGKITQAVVNISLIENQNPKMTVIPVPVFTKKIPKKPTPGPVPKRTVKIIGYSSDADTQAQDTGIVLR